MNNKIIDAVPSTDVFPSDFLLINVGVPFVIGLAVGYFAKKMLRVALFLGGAVIVLLFISEHYGVIPPIGEILKTWVADIIKQGPIAEEFLVTRLARLTSPGVSGVGGFLVGFKVG